MEAFADGTLHLGMATTASLVRQAASSIRWQLNWRAKHPDAAGSSGTETP
jgi:hypothetical protein